MPYKAISNVANTPRCYGIPPPYCSACVLYIADGDHDNDGEDCDYDENDDDNDDDNDDENDDDNYDETMMMITS